MEIQIKNILHELEQMPSLPAVASRILQMVLEDEFSLTELTGLVESDQALTLKILRWVNTADRGGAKISSVAHALPLIGIRALRILLLSVIVREELDTENACVNEHKALWMHSMACAIFSGLLADRSYPELRNEAFAAGMLHDTGKLFFLSFFPEKYLECQERIRFEKGAASLAEEYFFKTDHATIGRALAKKWHLPPRIEDAIWQHHLGAESVTGQSGLKELLFLVRAGNYLAHEALVDTVLPPMAGESMVREIQQNLKIADKELQSVRDAFSKEFQEHIALFDFDTNGVSLFYEVVQRANGRLSDIALELDKKNAMLSVTKKFSSATTLGGIAFSKIQTLEDFFQTVPKFINQDIGIQRGVMYWMDETRTFVEGLVWKSGGFEKLFSCALDENMQPLDSASSEKMNPGLKSLILSAKERFAKTNAHSNELTPRQFFISHGFTIFPLYGNGFSGELCLGRVHATDSMSAQEFMGYSQIVSLVVGTLDRIRLYNNLCRRADELSAALWKNRQVNLQLMQTERLAAVGQLAAGAAHEINNPLAIISARTQMIEAKEHDEKRKKELHQIYEQIERISSILTNLMGFARPASPQKSRVDLNALLDKVLDLVAAPMANQKINIVKKYQQNLSLLHADAGQLEQVFLNFCINAQHAMEEKGGTLTISTLLKNSGKRLVVTVADTGEGIAKKNLAQIFDPFFTTKEQGKGTGLGLSTAYGIVTNHYGNVEVQSTLGEGTTVYVEFPVVSADDAPGQSHGALNADKEIKNDGLPLSSQPCVLVVDDEEHIREILTETLTAHGCRVDSAENGKQGLEKLTRHIYDLMLIDIRMPSYSGLDLLARIKNKINGMPIFVVTGLASSEEMDKALELGATKCIRKPFHIKSLIQDINAVISLS